MEPPERCHAVMAECFGGHSDEGAKEPDSSVRLRLGELLDCPDRVRAPAALLPHPSHHGSLLSPDNFLSFVTALI